MPTVNLLPNATVSNNWTIAGGFGVLAHVAANTDDGDTKYLHTTSTNNIEADFNLDNIDFDGLNIGSITSDQVFCKARINERSKTYTI